MRSIHARRIVLSLATAAALASARVALGGALQSASDLFVVQVNGDGGGIGNADSVSINEYQTASFSSSDLSLAPVNTINLPTAFPAAEADGYATALTLPDTSDHDGQLSVSADGNVMLLPLYEAAVGSEAPNAVNITASIDPRVVAVIHTNGTIDYSTRLSGPDDYSGYSGPMGNGVSMRDVASIDGTQFWTVGNNEKPYADPVGGDFGGERYSTLAATTSISLNGGNGFDARTDVIYQNALYVDTGSSNSPAGAHTFYSVSPALPTSGTPTYTPLPNTAGGDIAGNQSPNFCDLSDGSTVLYESDSTNNSVDKYTLDGSTWTFDGRSSLPGIEDIATSVSGTTVTLYAVTDGGLFEDTDTGGAAGSFTGVSFTEVLTPASGKQFRGISFGPSDIGQTNQWALSTGGTWMSASDWTVAVPGGPGDTAVFGSNPGLAGNATIQLDANRIVGSITFANSAASYTIASTSGATLTIDNTGPQSTGAPAINVSSGSHTISVPVSLIAGVNIDPSTNATLTLSGSISGVGGLAQTGPGSLMLLAANSYSGDTTVEAGNLTLGVPGALPAGTNLTIASGAAVLDANHGVGPKLLLQLDSLLNAGLLDLSNNDMIIHNGNLASLSAEIAAGFDAGDWKGVAGITSSAAAATTNTALGIGQPLADGTFDGQSVTPSDVLVKYTYFGDANLDGVVNGSDYTLIDNGFNNSLTGWRNGDFNYDGVVNGDDYTLIDNAFNTQGPALTAVATESFEAAVPEPASMGLFALVGLATLQRSRHRRIASRRRLSLNTPPCRQ